MVRITSLLSEEQIAKLNKLKKPQTSSPEKTSQSTQQKLEKSIKQVSNKLNKKSTVDTIAEFNAVRAHLKNYFEKPLAPSYITQLNLTELSRDILPKNCELLYATHHSLNDIQHHLRVFDSWSAEKISCDTAIVLFEREIPSPVQKGRGKPPIGIHAQPGEPSIRYANFLFWEVSTGAVSTYLYICLGRFESNERGEISSEIFIDTTVDLYDKNFSLFESSGATSYLLRIFVFLSHRINAEPEKNITRPTHQRSSSRGSYYVTPTDIRTVTFSYLKSRRQIISSFVLNGNATGEGTPHSHRYTVRQHMRNIKTSNGIKTTVVRKHVRGNEEKPFVEKTRIYKF